MLKLQGYATIYIRCAFWLVPTGMRETRLSYHTENPMCRISQNTLSATQGTLELKDHHQWSSLRPTDQVFLDSPIGHWIMLTQASSCVKLLPAVEIITYSQQTLLWRDTRLECLHIYYKSVEYFLKALNERPCSQLSLSLKYRHKQKCWTVILLVLIWTH